MALAWFRNGKPEWTGRPLGSYEAWSRTVGGILEYCGMTGFLSNLENLYEQTDDEPSQWAVFLGSVFDAFGENNPFSTKTLIERITRENVHPLCNGSMNSSLKSVLPESLGDISDRGFSKRLGLAMRKRRDQIFELEGELVQLKEAFQDSHRQKPQWKLVTISNAPSAPFAPSSNGDTTDDEKILRLSDCPGYLLYSGRVLCLLYRQATAYKFKLRYYIGLRRRSFDDLIKRAAAKHYINI
jgi:hypothetical protein